MLIISLPQVRNDHFFTTGPKWSFLYPTQSIFCDNLTIQVYFIHSCRCLFLRQDLLKTFLNIFLTNRCFSISFIFNEFPLYTIDLPSSLELAIDEYFLFNKAQNKRLNYVGFLRIIHKKRIRKKLERRMILFQFTYIIYFGIFQSSS